MTWTSDAGVALGVALIVGGVAAIMREETMASPDGEPERRYEGTSAVTLGALWIVLGAGVLAVSLAPESTGGLIGYLRTIGRLFLGN
jgi:hypothetical protein